MRKTIWPAAAALLLLAATPALTYEQDTHYGLTYYLARQVGYIPQNAHNIANAAWSIDVNDDTEPAPVPIQGIKWVPLVSPAALLVQLKLRPTQITVLRSFHAFPDELPQSCSKSDDPNNVAALAKSPQISARETALRGQGYTLENPGFFLHYFEDSYSHAGFTCGNMGQGHAEDLHAPDYLSRKAQIAQGAAKATIGELTAFMTHQKLGVVCDADMGQVASMVSKLIAANPADARADTVPAWVLAIFGEAATGEGPDYDRAVPILGAGLPKDEPVPEFSKIQLAVKTSGNYLDASPVYTGARLQDQNGSIFLLNEAWRTADTARTRVKFSVDGSTPNPNAIALRAAHDWTFVSYDPQRMEWQFSRKPAPEELPKAIPPAFGSQDQDDWTWAKSQVQDKLQLHLVLTLEPHSCRLKGSYYRGYWRFTKDAATGERRAWIPDGRESWGSAESFDLVRDFPP